MKCAVKLRARTRELAQSLALALALTLVIGQAIAPHLAVTGLTPADDKNSATFISQSNERVTHPLLLSRQIFNFFLLETIA